MRLYPKHFDLHPVFIADSYLFIDNCKWGGSKALGFINPDDLPF